MNVIAQLICNYLTDDEFYQIKEIKEIEGLDENWYWDEHKLPSYLEACTIRHHKTLQFLKIPDKSHIYIDNACKYNNILHVKYLYSIGFQGSDYAIIIACQNDNYRLFKYLYCLNYKLNNMMVNIAIFNNNIQILNLLYKAGLRIKKQHLSDLCIYSSLNMIKFFYYIGEQFQYEAIDKASQNGHHDLVEFLISKSCTFSKHALNTDYNKIIKLLNENLDLFVECTEYVD